MDTLRICPSCQKPLAPDAPQGLCPECLIKAGYPSGTEPSPAGGFVPPAVEEIARLFPQFEILGFLGKGGMGAVYKARQPTLDRLVALKVLPPTSANDPGFAERFNREARALARLNHPNIVAVHDFGKAGSLHYLLMELVDGMNLRELERAGRLTPSQALAIVPQICAALQFAHNEGIVHRDIKPENLLVDTKGRVKITDFGIAKMMGAPAENVSLTGVRDIMGTPHYMAPEQIERPREVDHRADIYSLGVVFYEMLTGELPLGKFQAPSQKVQMDVRIDEVVLRALEKEPGRRYQQAGEVKTRVETIAGTPAPIAIAATGPARDVSDKTILPAFLLAFFFGVFGAHRFYVGKIRTGLVQVIALLMWIPLILLIVASRESGEPGLGLTLAAFVVGCAVWATIDWILLACKAFTDGQGRRIIHWNTPGPGAAAGIQPASPSSMPKGAREPRALIIAPAVALMVVGGLRIFSGLKAALILGGPGSVLTNSILSAFGIHMSLSMGPLVMAGVLLFTFVPAAIAILGAIEMSQLRNYPWALAGAIAGIVGCGLLGIIVGIWALVVLIRGDVRLAFSNAGTTWLSSIKWPWFAGAGVGIFLLLVISSMIPGASKTSHALPPSEPATSLLASIVGAISPTEVYAGDIADDSETNNAGSTNLSDNTIDAGAQATFSKTFEAGAEGSLTISADRGEIHVSASDNNTMDIKVTREVSRATAKVAAKILREQHLTFKRDGNKYTLSAVQPDMFRHGSWWNQPSLDVTYEVTVPRKFAAHVETLGGEISVDGVQGRLYAKTSGGEVKLKNIGGETAGETLGGDVTVENFSGPSLQAKTMGGAVSADFSRGPKADCYLHTMGGDVTVHLPAGVALRLDASTTGGDVTSELPVLVEGQRHDNRLDGTINGGGPALKLETLGGDVRVLKHN